MREKKQIVTYRESATVVFVNGAAVVVADGAAVVVDRDAAAIAAIVDDGAAVAVAVIADGAAIVVDEVATVPIDKAVDKSDVLAPSCEVGLNLNLSLKFNREGIFFNHGLCQKAVIWKSFCGLGEAELRVCGVKLSSG